MKDEALKLALEALESVLANHNGAPVLPWIEARDAIKQAIAAPVQEPVAWNQADELQCPICKITGRPYPKCGCITYTTPPAQRTWVGLTHDEFKQIMLATYNIDLNVPGHSSDDYLLWNAIEAKLKEKNTP